LAVRAVEAALAAGRARQRRSSCRPQRPSRLRPPSYPSCRRELWGLSISRLTKVLLVDNDEVVRLTLSCDDARTGLRYHDSSQREWGFEALAVARGGWGRYIQGAYRSRRQVMKEVK